MKRGVLFLWVLGAGFYGCGQAVTPATGVVVAVQSDLGEELVSVDVAIYDAAEAKRGDVHHFGLGHGVELPLSLGVAPRNDMGESFIVVARGTDQSGALLAEVKAKGKFVHGKTLGPLWLYLSSTCRGAGMCGPGQTCDPAADLGAVCGPIPSPKLGELKPGPLSGYVPTHDGGAAGMSGGGAAGTSGSGAGGAGGTGGGASGMGGAGTGTGGSGSGADGGMDAGGTDSGIDAGSTDGGTDGGSVIEDVALIATPGSTCMGEGAVACAGHNDVRKLGCVSGTWTLTGTCDGDTRCDPIAGTTLGTCQSIPSACVGKNPDDEVCDGSARKRCDEDLLRLEAEDCPAYAHCDAASAVTCVCDTDFQDNGAGGCASVNSCVGDPCGPGGTCTDGVSSYSCECATGYSGGGTQHACTNIDDCAGSPCGAGGSCVDGVATYTCNCAPGYSGTGTQTCTNITDCTGNPCGAGGTCVDGVNTYSCNCATGYSGTGTQSCTNINDCAGNPCGAGGTCIDGINTHSCTCASGYSGTGTQVCTNINDCAGSPCGVGTCADGVNTYTCTCPSGYSGTGTQACTNINDCPGNTCGTGGTCVDGVNTYTCNCASGYSGTGTQACTNINDCPGNTCGTGGTCIDGVNTYTCNCASGYSGTGTKVCSNIDDCVGNPCGAGGTCVDGVNSHSCMCSAGYSGTTVCSDINECAQTNVCTTDYPCQNLTPFYSCRGQYAEFTPSDSPTTFTVNSNGTVTDSRTGLIWQGAVDSGTYNWAEAKSHCAAVTVPSTGWRLPTKAELESIQDYTRNPAINPTVFPNTPASYFWSSSPFIGTAGSAYIVHFDAGGGGNYDTANRIFVRCVR